MQETMVHPPRTIMEVFRMLPEGTLAEVIDNTLYMSPTPVGKHQRLLRKLLTQLDSFISDKGLGEVFIAPLDVYLEDHSNAVQPDLFFISKAQSNIVNDNGHVHGVPELIIEILSPGNQKHDKVVKKNLYERFRVMEYWIVDPDTRQAIGYVLEGSSYKLIGEETGKINSVLLKETFTF